VSAFCLVCEHLDVSRGGGVVDRDMYLLVGRQTSGGALTYGRPVIRWPTRSNLAQSCLMSTWDHGPRGAPLVATNKNGLGSRFFRRPGPGPSWPDQRWRGRTRGACDAAERAALVPQVYSLLELLRIEPSAPGCAKHSVDPPVPLRPPARKPGEPLVRPYAG